MSAMFSELLNTPEFSLTKSRFSMDTFAGRCAYFFTSIDPRMCLENEKSLKDSQALLDTYRDGGARDVSKEKLWSARMAVDSCIHPTTKEEINPVFRFSAFIPFNFFIIPPMLLPSTVRSVPRTIFFHWMNQTYNCCINYANRASDEQPMSILLQAYAGALTMSLTAALGATFTLKRMGTTPSVKASIVRAVLPCFACGFAGAANVCLMRQSEWMTDGVPVMDEDGKVRGNSTEAGKLALWDCSVARILWNMPPLLIPPLVMIPLVRNAFVKRNMIATETFVCAIGMIFGVAPGLALFPLNKLAAPAQLEPRFQGLKRDNGEPVKEFSFYKGL